MMLGGKRKRGSYLGLIITSSTQASGGQLSFTWGVGTAKPRAGDIAIIITTWNDGAGGGTAPTSISWGGGFALGGYVSDDASTVTYPGHRIDHVVCTGSESGSFSTSGIGATEDSSAVYLLFRGVSAPAYCRRNTQNSSTLNPTAVTDSGYYTRAGDFVIGVGLHYLDTSNMSTPTSTSELKAYLETGLSGCVMGVAVWAPSNTGSDVAYDPAAFGVSGFTAQNNSTLTIVLLAP